MCTVSVIPIAGHERPWDSGFVPGFRLVMNRDEQRSRAPGLPPRARRLASGVHAAWPTDPQSGGTWVGVSELGVALALLNIYPSPDAPPHPLPARPVSRGHIIPALLDAPTAADSAARLARMSLQDFPPFRLICADASTPSSVIECRWDAHHLSIAEAHPPSGIRPCCFSSHAHGDRRARPRLALFDRWFNERAITPDEQDAFHRHQWAARPQISVRMSREDARTVSITSITVDPRTGASMSCEAGDQTTLVRLPAPRLTTTLGAGA